MQSSVPHGIPTRFLTVGRARDTILCIVYRVDEGLDPPHLCDGTCMAVPGSAFWSIREISSDQKSHACRDKWLLDVDHPAAIRCLPRPSLLSPDVIFSVPPKFRRGYILVSQPRFLLLIGPDCHQALSRDSLFCLGGEDRSLRPKRPGPGFPDQVTTLGTTLLFRTTIQSPFLAPG